MSVAEFVLAFVAIIIGLGVADLLFSLHRLLRAGRRVQWDWLAPAFATMMLLITVVFWWLGFHWYSELQSTTIVALVPKLLFLVVSFLMIAAALPDDVPADGINLREFYFASQIHIWTLMSLTTFLSILIFILDVRSLDFATLASLLWPGVTGLAFAIICIFSRRVWVHGLAIAWILGMTLYFNGFSRISS